ncbi:hypothetical protein GWI33_012259 [Rhynchophorus ferrugineus]|uniref:Uncharacterized protein n=1 Tax=Rhynchophorus ferrugineus TaxID=354439 RepID=A0A834MCK8_RHYFE|nr:hypothetical protein GWI33_012259 [Rhynchophorus ferrugineus]
MPKGTTINSDSPNLAPSDFQVFPKWKQQLGGQRFSKDEEVKEAVTKCLGRLTADIFEASFPKRIALQQKCVEKSSDYVGKWFKVQAFRWYTYLLQ